MPDQLLLGAGSDDNDRIVMPLRVGQPAAPVRVSNGLLLLTVCQRGEEQEAGVSREAIRQRIEQRRFGEAGRRLLRELRRSAVVDVRS